MKKLLLFLAFLPAVLAGQWQLSDEAEIRVLTCGPSQAELYSAFGHSAVRVYDPAHDLDLLYNYGVFDFNQPNFYLNFTRGHLLYKLSVTAYPHFRDNYISENRFIHEQILNLNAGQKQRFFNFLQKNALPENAQYRYDYFYDNCATRIRDGLETVLGDSLVFDHSHLEEEHSIRDLCDLYLMEQPWGDLGIDICLGLPMDKQATPYEYMFLPDYLEQGMANAELQTKNGYKPLVRETVITYSSEPEPSQRPYWTPRVIGWLLLLLGVIISFMGRRGRPIVRWFDALLFGTVGLVGVLLSLLWFFTDHNAAAHNFNLMWAVPIHVLVFWLIWKAPRYAWFRYYFGVMAIWYLLVLILWYLIPQDLHRALFPLTILLGLRSYLRFRKWE